MTRPTSSSTLFPYTTLFRSVRRPRGIVARFAGHAALLRGSSATRHCRAVRWPRRIVARFVGHAALSRGFGHAARSEEHTSELQSRRDLVCRLLLEKKKQ